MQWQQFGDGLARRVVLEDGTPVVAVLQEHGDELSLSFWTDSGELSRLESDSRKLGGLPDLIDALSPEDIIDVCRGLNRLIHGAGKDFE